jgi:selenocysteine lyase/cysteine desulfurase
LAPDVCGVLATQVFSMSGAVAPVTDVARACRARGVTCVVDVAQSAGILPLDVEALGADAVIGSCVKWLCGGPGAGFLWVRPELLPELRPIDVGWFSHARPFEFDIHNFEYAPDARRFWGGTPVVAPYVVAAVGLRLLHQIGVERIRAHNLALTARFRDELPAAWRARLRRGPTGGTLCIDTGAALPTVREALTRAGVRFDCRGSIMRLSFHAYNSADDASIAAQAWPSQD